VSRRAARRRAARPTPVWRGGIFAAAAAAPDVAAAPPATGVVGSRAAATTAAPGGDVFCGGGLSLYVSCVFCCPSLCFVQRVPGQLVCRLFFYSRSTKHPALQNLLQ